MTKKKAISLAVFLVFAAAGYIYFYADVFRKPVIQILHTRSRAGIMRRMKAGEKNISTAPVGITFALGKDYKLTSVKVVSLNEYQTNKYIHPLWSLVSDSNSVPTKAFGYGDNIRGMHTEIKGDRAEPLSNDVPYRLFVEAGKIKGEHDFTIPSAPATNTAAK